MEPCIEQRLIQLLRDSPSPAVPLRHLHEAITAEADGGAGSYTLFAESLRRRRDLFVVLETADPLGDATVWPAGTRSVYERALVEAGFDTGPRVSLADPDCDTDDPWPGPPATVDPIEAPLRQLRESLIQAWRVSSRDAALRSAVADALAACVDLPGVIYGTEDAGPTAVHHP